MSDFKLVWRGDEVVSTVRGAGADGVADALGKLLQSSNSRVPVDEGELKGSGRVDTSGLVGAVVYDAPHAVVVHENLEAHHENGQAKFLEATFAEEQRQLLEAVAAQLRAALK